MIRPNSWPAVLLAIAMPMATSCHPGKSPPSMGPDVLVIVGQTPIHQAELEAAARRRGITDPVGMSNLLEDLIDREIVVQVARSEGFDKRADVAELMKEQLVSLYRSQATGSTNPIPVSEAQARDYRDRHPDQFQREPRIRFAAFHLRVPVAAGETARGLARTRVGEITSEVGQRIPPPSGFGQLSARSEDVATRDRGGDIGWLTRDELALRWPTLTNFASFSRQSLGLLVGPLENGDDWTLLRQTGFEEGGPRPWEEVRQLAEHHARQEMLLNAARAQRDSLRTGVPVTRPSRR